MVHLFLKSVPSHCTQETGNSVTTVGYIMKPSREEDFAKVSSLQRNDGHQRCEKK